MSHSRYGNLNFFTMEGKIEKRNPATPFKLVLLPQYNLLCRRNSSEGLTLGSPYCNRKAQQ